VSETAEYRAPVPGSSDLTSTEAALLAFLAFGEKSGYDLARAFDRSVGLMWAPAKGHMYGVLPRLVERGWATSREVVQTRRPNKHLYRITQKGRTALARWLERPPGAEPERDMLLVKVFFGELAGESTILEHIRRRKAEAAELQAQLRAFDRGVPANERRLYPYLTRRYGILWAQFVIRWANEAERAIRESRG
jgi:DNA-binding PadR family transcriptional regulator